MGRIFDAMKDFFEEDDWKVEQLEGRTVLRMGFSGDDGNWNCFAQAREEQEQVVFYSTMAFRTPEDRRAQMAEFITRANYGMIIGNFEMDFADGEVRYKSSFDAEGTELTFAIMKQLVYPNVLTVDRYLKGMMAVAFGGLSAVDALKTIEG